MSLADAGAAGDPLQFLADCRQQMVRGFRLMRQIVDAAPMDAIAARISPGPSVASDGEILAWIRNNSQTAYIRSARAAWARGRRGVDDKLKVHRARRAARGRRLDFPDHAVGQHQRTLDHGRRRKAADILKARR